MEISFAESMVFWVRIPFNAGIAVPSPLAIGWLKGGAIRSGSPLVVSNSARVKHVRLQVPVPENPSASAYGREATDLASYRSTPSWTRHVVCKHEGSSA